MKEISRIKFRSFFTAIFACMTALLHAQQPVSRMLDYSAGLPSNTVYNILQDAKGYMWIAHEKGLSRYNGQTLIHYSNNMLQSRGLSNLSEDELGRIWCQNFSGDLFYTSNQQLLLNKELKSLGNYVPVAMYQGKKLVTIRNHKLILMDVETGKLDEFDKEGGAYAYANVLCSGDELYAVKEMGYAITYYKSLKQVWTVPLTPDIHPYIMAKVGRKLVVFPRMGTDKYMIIENGQVQSTGSLQLNTIIQNVSVIENKVWISTTDGAYCYDQNLGILNNGHPYFSDCNISSVVGDSEGSLWFGTLNKGVIVVPNLEVRLASSLNMSLTTASFFHSINKVITGSGNNQIFEVHPATLQPRLLRELKIKTDVIHIYNDVANDRIWVASDQLYVIRGATNSIEFQSPIPMKDVAYLENGYYALASPEGIGLLRLDGDTSDQSMALMLTGKTIPWIGYRQLLPGSEGRARTVAWDPVSRTLYGSNYKGLFSWTKGRVQTTYTHKGEQIYASSILTKGGKAYVGTFSGKLLIIEGGKIIRVIENFNGTGGQSVLKVKATGDHLWVLFESAVVRYNILTGENQAFTVSDGLPNTEIKDIAAGNGMVYLATRAGLVYFSEGLKKKKSSPRLYVEKLTVNLKPAIKTGEIYELRTNENNLEISLSVISFRNNAGIRILYNINNRQWIELGGAGRVLNLVGLAPGNYDVRFKAVTTDGREIMAAEHLKFKIAAPMYTRWWFILLVLILIAALVFYFMRFRIYELKKEAEFKSAKERLERELQISTLASIKSQMNPHFVFNALNTVQSFIFTNERENATDYLSKFSELTRMILDMSNKEKIPLAEEIKALTLYLELEKKRFEDSIQYQIIVNENISPEMVQIPSMLIQPYVENAIKHGLLHKRGDRKIKIEILKEGNAVIVFIDDNGIGRKKSQELKALKPSSHRSFASEANKRRLQLLNQGRENTIDIEYLDKLDSYGNSLGTMVVLVIPLNF